MIGKRQLLELALVFLLGAFMLFYVTLPLAGAGLVRLNSIIELHQGRKMIKSMSLEQIRARQQSLQAAADKARAYSRLGKERSQIIGLLNRSMAEAGLKAKDISSQPEKKGKQMTELGYMLNVRGKFPRILKCLQAIENSDLVNSVQSIKLTAPSLVQDDLSAEIQVVFYTQ